jgi:FAD/FMN-containing dehydrogenase
MQNVNAITLDGNYTQLDVSLIQNLKISVLGTVLTRQDTDYDKARQVWNAMIDRRPALIVQCSGTSDVMTAVRFANDHKLLVSVKCGGHNFGGLSVCDDGIMIDLSNMRKVQVDPVAKTARAQGGTLLIDLDRETQAFGLATTSGTVSHTGIAGLTLGGGQGWMMNKYGLTCDNLISADIVTADGQLLRAGAEENTDLYWAIRGGGGNFGIVTSFEYQLHSIGPLILGGLIVHPIDDAEKVLKFFREFSMNSPEELTLMIGMLCMPDGIPVIAIAAGWMGNIEEGKTALQPLRAFGSPVADMIGEIPYLQLQSIFDAAVAHGMPRYGKMGYLRELSDDFITTVVNFWNNRPTPYSLILFNTMKGAVTRVQPEETPFFHRHQQWHYDIVAQWIDKEDEEKSIHWAREFWNATVSFTNGASINFLGVDEGADRVRLSFGSNYDRLAAIKAKYDPENKFRMNANIIPKVKERDMVNTKA